MQSLEQGFVQEFVQLTGRMMMNRDGRDHTGIRRQANSGFTPQILDTYLPSIRRVMGTLLDEVQSRGRMDLVKEISQQLPSLVIAEFLGIPAEDQRRFLSWTQPLNEFFSPPPGTDMALLAKQTNDAMRELKAYLVGVIELRRQHPGHDMISHMLHAQEVGRMSLEELVANTILMVTAGYATTLEQLSNGVHDLLAHPEQFQKLKQDPGLVRSAVEEMLRFNPAAPFMTRLAVDTIQLRGRTIQKGQLVFLGMAAANRDPQIFPEPERFDITRNHVQQKHLSFAFGAHHCLGAGLARRELEVAIEMLIARLPGMRLDEESPPRSKNQGIIFRGFGSLDLRW
jgi:cytochrome P450 PksS